jgi:cobalt/nickel transport system ATP-binding protein
VPPPVFFISFLSAVYAPLFVLLIFHFYWETCFMLEVNNITVRYNADDPLPALSDISFSLDKGERIALTGNNGAGKSTLLLSLTGLLPLERGSIFFEGMELKETSSAAFRQSMGLVMQNPDDQLFMSTVYDDIAFGLRCRKAPESLIKIKAEETMAALGISGLRDRLTHRLSGGEKRLAALAGILIMEPAVMLLDEPAAFLDDPGRQRLMEILVNLPQAMIIASHDHDFASRLCSRVLHLERGRLQS